jgi:hypothetical protein
MEGSGLKEGWRVVFGCVHVQMHAMRDGQVLVSREKGETGSRIDLEESSLRDRDCWFPWSRSRCWSYSRGCLDASVVTTWL